MNKPPDQQRKVLGKGLSALLSRPVPPVKPAQEPIATPHTASVARIPIALIDPNPLQPRTVFDHNKIEELANSIRANGIIQPLIIRRYGERYQMVAGERRLRAAKLAEFSEVPAIIQDYADDRLLEIALVENIQREDLNPIETAQALERLSREMNLNHDEIGTRTGKDRATVTNLLRLLRLPDEVQLLLAEHRLSMGHAKAILGLPTSEQQSEMAQRTAAQGYSVRQVERLVQDSTRHRDQPDSLAEKRQDPNVLAAIRDLEGALGTRVKIVEKTSQRGSIQIEYYSQDDLNRIYEMITGSTQSAAS